uniref:Uncharacterized protein n=1 Tax=Zymomonas mobilis subsp. mobilis str. CP4 = NRRL B-14023 TaxID=627343 RepID=B3GN76_ZYMMB|nr:hypothetical protein [Zymomonas mobilis subsp. mobilis str. CP4 = NRRL B-14023]
MADRGARGNRTRIIRSMCNERRRRDCFLLQIAFLHPSRELSFFKASLNSSKNLKPKLCQNDN